MRDRRPLGKQFHDALAFLLIFEVYSEQKTGDSNNILLRSTRVARELQMWSSRFTAIIDKRKLEQPVPFRI